MVASADAVAIVFTPVPSDLAACWTVPSFSVTVSRNIVFTVMAPSRLVTTIATTTTMVVVTAITGMTILFIVTASADRNFRQPWRYRIGRVSNSWGHRCFCFCLCLDLFFLVFAVLGSRSNGAFCFCFCFGSWFYFSFFSSCWCWCRVFGGCSGRRECRVMIISGAHLSIQDGRWMISDRDWLTVTRQVLSTMMHNSFRGCQELSRYARRLPMYQVCKVPRVEDLPCSKCWSWGLMDDASTINLSFAHLLHNAALNDCELLLVGRKEKVVVFIPRGKDRKAGGGVRVVNAGKCKWLIPCWYEGNGWLRNSRWQKPVNIEPQNWLWQSMIMMTVTMTVTVTVTEEKFHAE